MLAGTPTLRRAEGDERALAPGEVVAFPAGPEGVHQVVNRAGDRARVLICSTNDVPGGGRAGGARNAGRHHARRPPARAG